MRLNISILRLF